jgi:hypothetical protein
MMMMMMVPSIPNDTQSLLCCTLAFMAENRALFRFTMIPPGLYNPPPPPAMLCMGFFFHLLRYPPNLGFTTPYCVIKGSQDPVFCGYGPPGFFCVYGFVGVVVRRSLVHGFFCNAALCGMHAPGTGSFQRDAGVRCGGGGEGGRVGFWCVQRLYRFDVSPKVHSFVRNADVRCCCGGG